MTKQRKLKLCFIGDMSNVHCQRLVNFFVGRMGSAAVGSLRIALIEPLPLDRNRYLLQDSNQFSSAYKADALSK